MSVLLTVGTLTCVSAAISVSSRPHTHVDLVICLILIGRSVGAGLAKQTLFVPLVVLNLELLSLFVDVGNVLLRVTIFLLHGDLTLGVRPAI